MAIHPQIQVLLDAHKEARPLMAQKNVDHLAAAIEANPGLITPEVFGTILTETGSGKLVDLKEIYAVRNKLTAVINSGGGGAAAPAAAPAPAAAAPKPPAPPSPPAPTPTPAAAPATGGLGEGFDAPTPAPAAAAPKKLTANKNPVMSTATTGAATAAPETPADSGGFEDVLTELPPFPGTETPGQEEVAAETLAIDVAAETVTPEVTHVTPAGTVMAGTHDEAPGTVDTGDIPTPPWEEPPSAPVDAAAIVQADTAGDDAGVEAGLPDTSSTLKKAVAAKGAKGKATASAPANNVVAQLLAKIDERDAVINDLRKQVADLEKAVGEADQVKLDSATTKRLAALGIEL